MTEDEPDTVSSRLNSSFSSDGDNDDGDVPEHRQAEAAGNTSLELNKTRSNGTRRRTLSAGELDMNVPEITRERAASFSGTPTTLAPIGEGGSRLRSWC